MSSHSTQSQRLQYGPYRIFGKVGSGGMAKVYKARHHETGEVVALKIATEIALLDPTLRKRFHREFEVARSLCHPHLVHALDCGEVEDALYQALEYVEGQNLDQRIRNHGPLPLDEALALFTQIAEALRYMHKQGVVHRDIKPSNIMLHANGSAKLADFGLLKNLASQSSVLTRSNQSLGTIVYGAPEQFEDAKRADVRCDLYSLAATFYNAVTGELPFGSGGNIKILRRKLQNQFVPLGQMAPAIIPALDQIISRCLHPDPSRRPQSTDEFIACLDEQRRSGKTGIPAGLSERKRPNSRDENRRETRRSPVHLDATCEPMFAQGRKYWTAAVKNLSSTGLCLECACSFEIGTVLQVNLRVPGAAETPSKLVRVRWAKPSELKQFAMGCEFVQPLAAEEFDTLHQAGTPKTAVIQAARP